MQIVISRSAWHIRLYKWLYNTYRLPNSLCPYFWGLVAALILVIPIGVLMVPSFLFVLISGRIQGDYDYETDQPAPWLSALIGMFVISCGLWLYTAGLCIVHLLRHRKTSDAEQTCLALLCFVVGVVLIGYIVSLIRDWCKDRRNDNPYKSYNAWYVRYGNFTDGSYDNYEAWYKWKLANMRTSFWSIIWQGIKTIYSKACPIINWR